MDSHDIVDIGHDNDIVDIEIDNLFNDLSSEDEYITDDDEREYQANEIKRGLAQTTLDLAHGMAYRPLRLLINKIYNIELDGAPDNTNSTDIKSDDNNTKYIDDKVYSVKLELVPCSYKLNDAFNNLIGNPVANTVKQAIDQLVQSIYMTLPKIQDEFNFNIDLKCEQQTGTFYFHYNDQWRIAPVLNIISIHDYDDKNVYTTDLVRKGD